MSRFVCCVASFVPQNEW